MMKCYLDKVNNQPSFEPFLDSNSVTQMIHDKQLMRDIYLSENGKGYVKTGQKANVSKQQKKQKVKLQMHQKEKT